MSIMVKKDPLDAYIHGYERQSIMELPILTIQFYQYFYKDWSGVKDGVRQFLLFIGEFENLPNFVMFIFMSIAKMSKLKYIDLDDLVIYSPTKFNKYM